MRCLLFRTIFVFFFFQFQLLAVSVDFNDAVYPELVTSGRALSMGNAFISKVDDSAATFYNPAGLGSLRKTSFFNFIHMEFSKGWMESGGGGKIADAVSNIPKGFSLDGTREILLENRGKFSSTRFDIAPSFSTRYFSAGYLLSLRQNAYLGNGATDKFKYAKRQDHGPFAALNISLYGGVFKFGVVGVILNRNEASSNTHDPLKSITLEDSDYKKGTTGLVTGGAKLTLPWFLLPTFSTTFHNISDQDFSARAAGKPTKIEPTIDLGFSITPQLGKQVRLHLEANLKDSSQAYDNVPASRKLVLGAEFDFARSMFLRFGYGDGWGSYGFGLKAKALEIDITSYATELEEDGFREKENRRFAISISAGF